MWAVQNAVLSPKSSPGHFAFNNLNTVGDHFLPCYDFVGISWYAAFAFIKPSDVC